jgi:hypothetical protein
LFILHDICLDMFLLFVLVVFLRCCWCSNSNSRPS